MSFAVGVFIMLHGLVHLWYVALSQRLVAFQPEMGWCGFSWVFSGPLGDVTTRTLAGALYLVATVAFVTSGIGVLARQEWATSLLVGSAAFSSAVMLLFWDGSLELPVQKGLLGLLINTALLAFLLLRN